MEGETFGTDAFFNFDASGPNTCAFQRQTTERRISLRPLALTTDECRDLKTSRFHHIVQKALDANAFRKFDAFPRGQLNDRYRQLGKLTFWPLIFIIWPRELLDAYAFRKFDAFLKRQLNGR